MDNSILLGQKSKYQNPKTDISSTHGDLVSISRFTRASTVESNFPISGTILEENSGQSDRTYQYRFHPSRPMKPLLSVSLTKAPALQHWTAPYQLQSKGLLKESQGCFCSVLDLVPNRLHGGDSSVGMSTERSFRCLKPMPKEEGTVCL